MVLTSCKKWEARRDKARKKEKAPKSLVSVAEDWIKFLHTMSDIKRQ